MCSNNRTGSCVIGLVGPVAMVLVGSLAASAFSQQVGVVSQIKVLSDRVEDVSDLEAWRQSWIKPGMSDEEKAIAPGRRDLSQRSAGRRESGRQVREPRRAAVHVRDPDHCGQLILRMPSSYVYLTGTLAMAAVVPSGGKISVELSDNNGLDWKQVAELTQSADCAIDLPRHVLRRYDYRLKFELRGRGTGLDRLKITHDIQHSQAPLPAFVPVKITYVWDEGSVEKYHVHVAGEPSDTYEVVCGKNAVMKSLILEIADPG